MTEQLGVGTLKAIPSNLPLTDLIIFPIDLAAPVVVGIILVAAARALLKSLCDLSKIF